MKALKELFSYCLVGKITWYIYIYTHIIYYQCSMIRVVVFECSFRIGQSSNQPVVAFTKDLWLWCRKCLALHDQWISKRQQAKHNSVICLYGWAFAHPQTPLPGRVNIRCWCQFEPGLSANHHIPLSLPPIAPFYHPILHPAVLSLCTKKGMHDNIFNIHV